MEKEKTGGAPLENRAEYGDPVAKAAVYYVARGGAAVIPGVGENLMDRVTGAADHAAVENVGIDAK